MLAISTIPEALAEIKRRTGRDCEGSELLDVAINNNIELHADPSIKALVETKQVINGEWVLNLPNWPSAPLAVLSPPQLRQLSISNETTTRYPIDHTNHLDDQNGAYKRFTEPVHVTRDQVRITDEALKKILELYSADAPTAKVEAGAVTSLSGGEPWLIANSDDPAPEQPWYISARYFARQLVKDDSTLLTKKKRLAAKVATSLAGVGIFKRGKKKQSPSSGTVLKSFINVTLK